ncbi:MAG: bifunctional ornithine acetyltransferase/N-acetylglutamate synthase, partial [Oscillospiraceae bacterium]|nr:bifunctional ornithine acetyltransferase/N-acetylglutamate synthase [Oscillospiraceae bacterium]
MTSKVKPVIFNNAKITKGGVCAAKGFKASGIDAGISKDAKRDLAIIACENKCNTAAVFTTNQVKAAPVVLSAGNVANGTAQAVVVNSGNANACTDFGMTDAEVMRDATAQALGIAKEDVIVASTGVIGQELPIEPIKTAIPALTAALSETGSAEAAEAIMTTDTFAKEFAVSYELTDGKVFNVGGIAKGSGMINPNMATLLAFITTDAAISVSMLEQALKVVNSVTYNMVCVDGDTSTNDMVCVMASGMAGNKEITEEDEDYEIFADALYAVMVNLARETARDGEGATKLLECIVRGAPDEETAKSIAKTVISSNL